MSTDWYRSLGVSAHKSFLAKHHAKDYFAAVLPDIAGEATHRFALHADGVGTKGILAYLWWREKGDESIWYHLAQDALVMNTDDMACSGITEGFVFSTTITRNPFHIPDSVVGAIIDGVYAFTEHLNQLGISAQVAGGETADMPDIVRTVGIEATAAARVATNRLIPLRRPEQEILIVGLASFGQTNYETTYNSGIGSNGITAIRHLLLSPVYKQKYPETVADELPNPYQGRFHLSDRVHDFFLGDLLTAPTRTYLPYLRQVYENYRQAIYAVIHCTGGGQRKVMKYLPYTLIRKDNFFPLPPMFSVLEGLRPWSELFEVLNMGHRMEIYALPSIAEELLGIATQYNLPARIIGSARPHEGPTRIEASFQGTSWCWEGD
ncbi:MAG: phosphoribosylformylglycinamidine cyclo-ligase [Bacteroidia bacterium]|nr:phosphoribosylformylglycinamidine cyclo-ligase [Bacteroidia bacterium]MCX7651947.1 phosphoribosylformylglycinamidine cyclo-ligase [Bacteroidia bacterium]MDW8416098.1 phosphoribosylformylglycinamidine cyclo-ligase [Bacteroidia bacterium]